MKLTAEQVIKAIKDSGLTAYKIAEGLNGELTEVGINKILNGTSKNPHQKTLVKIHNYLAKYSNPEVHNEVHNNSNNDPYIDALTEKLFSSEKFKKKLKEEQKQISSEELIAIVLKYLKEVD
jgi:hypothetical protein